MNTKKTLLGSALVLYFVIAFEVLIMISPFAGFFYSLFNPVLLKLAGNSATRWLSAFYLPHMVLPQDPFLQFLRVMGSVLFVAGIAVFFGCAVQIYSAKFRKKGAVARGLYSLIRHPQYLALGIAGLGLSILWPRLLTIALWVAMLAVYYFIARDEERRMLKAHPGAYKAYRNRTGMFLPKAVESALTPGSGPGKAALALGLAGFVFAGAFLLRAYTVSHLTLWTKNGKVAGLAVLPEDGYRMDHRMGDILALDEVKNRIEDGKKYLAYFIPKDYIMQGMIADTGGDWKLFEQHRTIGMIADWIFHPFGHLREGHHGTQGGKRHRDDQTKRNEVIRRLIFLSIEDVPIAGPRDLFSINALRVPRFMADVEVHTGRLLAVEDLPRGSGWGAVPTPVF